MSVQKNKVLLASFHVTVTVKTPAALAAFVIPMPWKCPWKVSVTVALALSTMMCWVLFPLNEPSALSGNVLMMICGAT